MSETATPVYMGTIACIGGTVRPPDHELCNVRRISVDLPVDTVRLLYDPNADAVDRCLMFASLIPRPGQWRVAAVRLFPRSCRCGTNHRLTAIQYAKWGRILRDDPALAEACRGATMYRIRKVMAAGGPANLPRIVRQTERLRAAERTRDPAKSKG